MQHCRLTHLLEHYGPECRVVSARWAPSASATQTLTEAFGITSITRSGAGAYVVNLAIAPRTIIMADVTVVENDTTTYHFARVESTSASAKTITISHKSVAFASVASGPTASDTVDELMFVALLRIAS